MLDQYWDSVVDGGPTLVHHCVDVSCLLGFWRNHTVISERYNILYLERYIMNHNHDMKQMYNINIPLPDFYMFSSTTHNVTHLIILPVYYIRSEKQMSEGKVKWQ